MTSTLMQPVNRVHGNVAVAVPDRERDTCGLPGTVYWWSGVLPVALGVPSRKFHCTSPSRSPRSPREANWMLSPEDMVCCEVLPFAVNAAVG